MLVYLVDQELECSFYVQRGFGTCLNVLHLMLIGKILLKTFSGDCILNITIYESVHMYCKYLDNIHQLSLLFCPMNLLFRFIFLTLISAIKISKPETVHSKSGNHLSIYFY